MRVKIFVAALGAVGLAVAACATGSVTDVFPADDGGGGGDVADVDGGCPQYDLTKDPAHCGSCTHACAAGDVCSGGQCKAQCDSPTTKCPGGDGGVVCATTNTDPLHCGGCSTVCGVADAGSLAPGNHNPDAGFPYDGGSGWSLGAPACDGGACGTACAGGTTVCPDGICYDTQNFHDHCGDCNTACAADTEWCNSGHCCTLDKMYCGGSCVDVLSDTANCGGCGIACSGGTPYCAKGVCTAAPSCVNNAQWMPVNCTTTAWVWSSNRSLATTVNAANTQHLLWAGCAHTSGAGNTCSLTGTGWVSTAVTTMSGCDASWYHLGGSYTGNCGGHDGDQVRRLVVGPNDCYAY